MRSNFCRSRRSHIFTAHIECIANAGDEVAQRLVIAISVSVSEGAFAGMAEAIDLMFEQGSLFKLAINETFREKRNTLSGTYQ